MAIGLVLIVYEKDIHLVSEIESTVRLNPSNTLTLFHPKQSILYYLRTVFKIGLFIFP